MRRSIQPVYEIATTIFIRAAVNLTVYRMSLSVIICAAMFYSLIDAAEKIGISRAWLYRKYLPRYKPIRMADKPMLSKDQINQIKAEIKAELRIKQSNGNGHK